MKSFFKSTFFASIFFTFLLLGTYSVVFSAPGGVAPLQNVLPNFSALTVTGAATLGGGLTLNAGTISKADSSVLLQSNQEIILGDNTGNPVLTINNLDGSLSNPKNNDPVRIDDNEGFSIFPPDSNTATFSIASTGFISNPSNNPVRIVDPDGFVLTNDLNEDVFTVNGSTGAISSPIAGNPVKIVDANGVAISNNSSAINLQLTTNGLRNPSTNFNGRVTIKDDEGLQFNDDEGNYKIGISGTTGNLNTVGWITASNGIGSYGTRYMSINIGAGSSASPSLLCGNNEIALSCGHATTAPFGTFQIREIYANGGSWTSAGRCEYNVRNTGNSNYNFTVYARCFSPSKNVY